MSTKPITNEAYVARSGHCPYCDSDNISGGPVQVDTNTAWQEICCGECANSWNDLYQLVGYEVMP